MIITGKVTVHTCIHIIHKYHRIHFLTSSFLTNCYLYYNEMFLLNFWSQYKFSSLSQVNAREPLSISLDPLSISHPSTLSQPNTENVLNGTELNAMRTVFYIFSDCYVIFIVSTGKRIKSV